MKIVLGADHGGWQMKEDVKEWLGEKGYEVKDVGAKEKVQDDDYIDFAVLAVKELQEADKTKGFLFCRNGFGMVIAANRFGGVRCGLGFDAKAVEKGRMDDDINCLAFPADYVELESVKEMIEIFLETELNEDEKYKGRLSKLNLIK
jgi:ribose 5-phosphate isomerase B